MPYNASNFAKSQLHKSGWVQGKGLGKKEDGMSEAIKVKIKADKTGIGHDHGEQFTFHWWEHAFKKSAQNIKVTEGENGVEVETKNETEIASTRKRNKKLMKERLLYGSFVKSGILENGKLQSTKSAESESDSSNSESESSVKKSKILTDEELLAACGGRTAHKGARHGLKSSAKLARLQEQEVVAASDDSDKNRRKELKKKRKKEAKNRKTKLLEAEVDETVAKFVKQLEGVTEQEKCDSNPNFVNEELSKQSIKKRPKKPRKKETENGSAAQEAGSDVVEAKRKKKRKKSKLELVQ